MADEETGKSSMSLAENMFEQGWLEIDAKIRRLKQDLELAERRGLGEDTLRAIGEQLLELKDVVSEYEAKWVEFERNRHALKSSLDKK